MQKAIVVVGSAYGDEGKGLMTDYFCHYRTYSNSIGIRYNGGAQAGHTVITPKDRRHVFHHLSSGTFTGTSTYLTKEFIVNPLIFNLEIQQLEDFKPFNIFINKNARVSTPYDMLANQKDEEAVFKIGTCGAGIFKTIQRHGIIPLTVGILENATVAQIIELLQQIKSYYNFEDLDPDLIKKLDESFILSLVGFFNNTFVSDDEVLMNFKTLVFEGAQGLLLNEKHGVYPYLTPSDPGVTTPIDLCNNLEVQNLEVCYVTRCYTTRHGGGPLDKEVNSPQDLGINTENETNLDNQYQGKFRYAELNYDKIMKAVNADFALTSNFKGTVTKSMAITCLDQIHADYAKRILKQFPNQEKRYCSYGPSRLKILVS